MPVHQREMLIRFYLQEQRPEGIQEAFGTLPQITGYLRQVL